MIRTSGRALRTLAPLVSAALFLTACGGDDGGSAGGNGGGDGGASAELTAIIPFPSGISFYPLFVAQ